MDQQRQQQRLALSEDDDDDGRSRRRRPQEMTELNPHQRLERSQTSADQRAREPERAFPRQYSLEMVPTGGSPVKDDVRGRQRLTDVLFPAAEAAPAPAPAPAPALAPASTPAPTGPQQSQGAQQRPARSNLQRRTFTEALATGLTPGEFNEPGEGARFGTPAGSPEETSTFSIFSPKEADNVRSYSASQDPRGAAANSKQISGGAAQMFQEEEPSPDQLTPAEELHDPDMIAPARLEGTHEQEQVQGNFPGGTLGRRFRAGTLGMNLGREAQKLLEEMEEEDAATEVDSGKEEREEEEEEKEEEEEEKEEEEYGSMEAVMKSGLPMSERRRLRNELLEKKGAQQLEPVSRPSRYAQAGRGMWDSFSLWGNSLHKVEAQYGSAVASFFKFLKWMMLLNLAGLLIILGLILVPQVAQFAEELAGRADFRPDRPSADQCLILEHKWVAREEDAECCSANHEEGRSLFRFEIKHLGRDLLALLADLLQATNWMSWTPLFYGYYSGTYVFEYNGVLFDFPLAYFLAMLSVFLINLVAVVFSSAKSFRNTMQLSDIEACTFSNLVYGIWDWRITWSKGIDIQRTDVARRIRTELRAEERRREKDLMKKKEKYILYSIRLAVNLFVLACLCGAAYAIYYVTGSLVPSLLEDERYKCSRRTSVAGPDAADGDLTLLETATCFGFEYAPSLVITFFNMFLPFVFTYLIQYEGYGAGAELTTTLARCIFIRLASLVIAFFSIYSTISCDYATGCTDPAASDVVVSVGQSCDAVADADAADSNLVDVTACSNRGLGEDYCLKPQCWETYVGQQFYKLTVIDLLIQVGLVLFVDLPRSWLFGRRPGRLSQMLGGIEFNISKHVLDIVYSQTICWLAVFYAPGITAITMAKCFVLFYLRLFYVLHICKPASLSQTTRTASSLFKFFLLLSFVVCSAAVGFTVAQVQPSLACGPFRDVRCGANADADNNAICLVYDYAYEIIDNADETLKTILYFLSQTTVLYLMGGFLLLVLYCYWAYGQAQLRLLKMLKADLVDISKDKTVLLYTLEEELIEQRARARKKEL